jgi:hypothetical protein
MGYSLQLEKRWPLSPRPMMRATLLASCGCRAWTTRAAAITLAALA